MKKILSVCAIAVTFGSVACGDAPEETAADAESAAIVDGCDRACWRARPPGYGVRGYPVASISYDGVVDDASLVRLEIALLMQMRTTGNPLALYAEAASHVDAMPRAGNIRAKYKQFVRGDGRYAAMIFSLQIRQSQDVGWTPGTYVRAPKWSLGDLVYQDNGRSFEDYHPYDDFRSIGEMEKHFDFAGDRIALNKARVLRLYDNAYRLPQDYLPRYLADVQRAFDDL